MFYFRYIGPQKCMVPELVQQNCKITIYRLFSCNSRLVGKPKEKDHWRQCPLKRYQLTVSCFDESFWSCQAEFHSDAQFWELVDGEEGKSVSEPLPPLGAGCHSATKTSIILSVRIVENFFWVMHASMNSSCVICPSWFSSISWKADSASTS